MHNGLAARISRPAQAFSNGTFSQWTGRGSHIWPPRSPDLKSSIHKNK